MSEETQESMPAPVCQILRAMAAQATLAKREMCGLIVHKDQEWSVLEIPNTSPSDDNFRMSTEDLLEAWSTHEDNVIGCWHTHERSTDPSAQDREFAPAGMRYWIATEKLVVEYDFTHDNATIVHRWPDGARS